MKDDCPGPFFIENSKSNSYETYFAFVEVDARVAIIDNGGGAGETDTIPKIGFVSIITSSFYNAFLATVEVYSLKGP